MSGVRSDKTFADTSPCQAGLGISAASNYGNYVDIAAPFWGLSTVGNNGYGDESDGYCGTSMAAPHVAGAAALLRAAHPTWTNAQIRDTLLAKAEDLGASGWDPYFGHGLLNVAAAFGYLGPLQVDIAGSWTPPMNTWCTWNAVVSGGFPPYSYKWYVDGNFVSPVSSYGGVTGTTDFLLRLEVTDALMNMNYKELLVDVQFMGSC